MRFGLSFFFASLSLKIEMKKKDIFFLSKQDSNWERQEKKTVEENKIPPKKKALCHYVIWWMAIVDLIYRIYSCLLLVLAVE